MPRFDGTGPIGQGAMTGRGMGYCAVPVSLPASAARPVARAPMPYYPATALPFGAAAHRLPVFAYAPFGRPGPFRYARGFGRRGGRGRRRRWWW